MLFTCLLPPASHIVLLKLLLKYSIFILLVLVSVLGSAQEQFNHDIWNTLLQQHVHEINSGLATQVDYRGLQQQQQKLNQYLQQLTNISRTTFESWDTSTQLAFLINAYNAWTIQFILTKYPNIDSIKDLGSWLQSPWKKSFIPLLEATRSLDNIEHQLIRNSGRYNEPRIHFAVNCASIGCPALLPEAYQGNKLETQLETATLNFLKDRSRNHLEQKTLWVSSIFKWYRQDFSRGWRKQFSLTDFFAFYASALDLSSKQQQSLKQGKIKIKFLDYNWRLNHLP